MGVGRIRTVGEGTMPVKVNTQRGYNRMMQIFAEILEFRRTHGYGPFKADMARSVNLSENTVGKYVKALESKNLIRVNYRIEVNDGESV